MNIHLMPNQKFAGAFIQLLNEYPVNENTLYLYGRDKYIKTSPQNNVFLIDDFKNIDLGNIKGGDKLVLHGFYDRALIRFVYYIRRKFNKQLIVIAWGADIYNGRFLLKDRNASLREKLSQLRYEYYKRGIVKKANVFMTFASPDMEVLRKYYGAKGIHVDCLYPSNVDIVFLRELLKEDLKNPKVRVMLGNSASRTNNHLEMLEVLFQYKGLIEVICPLSYGDFDYARTVKSKGLELFGEDFKAIEEYYTPNNYTRLLNSVNIAIFNNNRQEATGNIEILGFLKKKIYLRSDTSLWGHYVLRDGCIMFDVLKIKGMPFESFCSFNDEDGIINNKYFSKIWDPSYVRSLWDEAFNCYAVNKSR